MSIAASDPTSFESENKKGSFAVLLTASLVSSLIMLDSNVVAVSLPAIGRSLNATFTEIEWVISAYVLTYAALLLAAGNFADLRGRRLATILGLVIFAAASAACGLATSATMLNVSRAVQGVGGALLLTASLAVIAHAFTGKERAGAFAFWGASLGIALAVGPIIGGAITSFFGWRWVFLVNLPASGALIVATIKVVDESRDPKATRLDFFGIFTFSFGLGALIWALMQGNEIGWTSLATVIRLVISSILFAAFVTVERRQQRPMVDFSLFAHRTFLGAVLAMIGYGASAQVMVFFLPLYLQNAYAFTPLIAGVAMIPFALPMVLAPRFVGGLTNRFSGRDLLTAGLAMSAAGNISFWFVAKEHAAYPTFVLAMVLAGCGAGLLNGQTVKVLQGAVSEERAGMASGLASTTRFIGILVSVAALGAVLSNVARSSFTTVAVAAGLAPDVSEMAAKSVTSGDLVGMSSVVPPDLQSQLQTAGLHAYADGFAAAALLAAVLAAVACVLTFVFVSAVETAPNPIATKTQHPCMAVDCRHPL